MQNQQPLTREQALIKVLQEQRNQAQNAASHMAADLIVVSEKLQEAMDKVAALEQKKDKQAGPEAAKSSRTKN
jgi:tetrahydromethanopterin S-methyltransferase subunit A